MTPVFLDTVGLLALWDSSDQWHAGAEKTFAELRATQRPVLTTTFVLLECGNAAARRPYRQAVERLRVSLETGDLLARPTENEVDAAWTAYRRGENDKAAIVDQVSFIVMRRLGLTEAFTNDRHFRAAGFKTLF